MSDEGGARPRPILVLGIGNSLLGDDGVGLELLARLEAELAGDPRFECVDGGTQGLALLGWLPGRRALVILDAVGRGAAPGTVHRVADPSLPVSAPGVGAHEGNGSDLLAAARLLGDEPPYVSLVGVEPERVRTGIGLSDTVRGALPAALDAARRELRAAVRFVEGSTACTS